jgi:hypothetical protein
VYHIAAFQSLSIKVPPDPAELQKEYPMLRSALLIFAVLCVAILVGCSKTETTNSNSMGMNGNKPMMTNSPSTSTASSSGEKIGIPECDDFIAKYEACVSKAPEAQRAQFQAGLKQWRDSWRQLAQNPMTKGTLAAACKQAAEQAKTSMKEYNCTF